MSGEFLLHFLAIVFGAGAVYGAIKSDLRVLHEKVAGAIASATRAHERLDNHLEKTQ